MDMQLYELSHAQKRILLSQQTYSNKPVCNIGGYAIFHGEVEIDRLKDTLFRVVEFYDVFSIRLCRTAEGDHRQYFMREEPEISIWELEETSDDEKAILPWVQRMLAEPFSLYDKPLFRLALFQIGKNKSGYAICCHHIIFDGWSMRLFTDAVSMFYDGCMPPRETYLDYLEEEQQYLASPQAENDRLFWEDMVKEFEPDRIYTENGVCHGSREEYLVPESLQRRLVDIGASFGGVNMVMYAFAGLMEFYRRDNCPTLINVPIYNRRGKRMKAVAGMLTSSMLLGIPCETEWTLSQFMEKIRRRLGKTLRHQRWPYDMIGNRNHARFRCSVNCYNMNLYSSIGTAKGKYQEVYSGCQVIPFQMILNTWEEPWHLIFDLRNDLFYKKDGRVMMRFLKDFLMALEQEPQCTIKEFARKLEKQERKRQEKTFLNNLPTVSLSTQLQKIFIPEYPKDVAIYHDGKSITREQLADWLRGAAKCLTDAGLRQGDKIVLLMKNGLEYIVYTIAAAGLGIVFIPLDVDMSEEQISFVLRHSAAVAVVTAMNLQCFFKQRIIPPLLKQNTKNFQWPECSDTELAYCIYTSGTTGKPKGVTISREALASYLSWSRAYYCSDEKLNFFLFTSPAFDLSLTALFLPLTSGGRLVTASYGKGGLHRLHELQNASQITAIKATPSHLELLLRTNTTDIPLKTIISGGEVLTVSLAKRLQQHFGSNCRIYNEYGPTECTIGCMYHQFDNLDEENYEVSLGCAAPGCRVYVVSENGYLAYEGTVGEIYLAGKQLAAGYLNEPEKTHAVFLQDFLGETLIYRTGDMARYENGRLTYLGRRDNQKKVNGHRIELDGVEISLKSIVGVTNAGVWIDSEARQTLCAAVETENLTEDFIRAELLKKLPAYCVPHRFFLRKILPINPNGKLDTTSFQTKTKKFQGEVRHMLEPVIRKVLKYDGSMDTFDYFAAGGDSVQALLLSAALEEAGLFITVSDILTHPRIEELETLAAGDEIWQTQVLDEYPLPRHLQYLSETCIDFRKYRHTLEFRLNQELSQERVDEIYRLLLEKFPPLQAEFDYTRGIIRQQRTVETLLHAEEKQRSDIHHGNLFAFDVECNMSETRIRISLHHILADAVSWKLLLDAFLLLAEGKEVRQNAEMELFRLNDMIEYHWPEQAPLCSGEYFVRSTVIPLTFPIDFYSFIDLCIEVLTERLETANMVLLCDWNGRTMFKHYKLMTTIGCYSVFLPVERGKGTARNQIEILQNQKQVELPSQEKAVRVNFLGDFRKLIPAKLEFMQESLQRSMEACSAHGCAAEITCIGNATEMTIYIATRSIWSSELVLQVLEDISERFRNPMREDLLEFDEQEMDTLFYD